MKKYISPKFEETVLVELSTALAGSNVDFSSVSNEDLVDSGYVLDWN
ncbi:MAG: hypothetical protein J5771_05040 [Bacteroidales bacterium]|nr:hypothetical protein [Bacteroidales bacterium]